MAERITVSNELPSVRGGQKRHPFDTKIIPLDGSDDPVALPHSPRGHERSVSPNWSEDGTIGAGEDRRSWKNSAPPEVSFSVRIQSDPQGIASDKPTPIRLDNMLSTLERWATEPSPITGEPIRVVLRMGAKTMGCTIDNMDINVIDKTPEGLPLTVKLSMVFVKSTAR